MDNVDNIFNEIDKEMGFTTLVQGLMGETPFWAYVAIKPTKFEAFMKLKETDSCLLTDYGDVLEYKQGEVEPSVDIKAMMEEKYDVRHDLEECLQTLMKDFAKEEVA